MSKIGDKAICEYDGYEWHPLVDGDGEIVRQKIYNTGEAAKILKIPYYSLQYAEQVGNIPQASRSTSGHRIYTEDDLSRLKKMLQKKEKLEFVAIEDNPKT